MSKKKKEAAPEQFETVENVLSKSEQFIENNQKTLTTIVLVILILVAGFLAFNRYYKTPMEEEAQGQMFRAEQYFAQDSFQLALNGDGNYLGFLDIIDEYGITKSANLANYYAGISYLKTGQYNQAIEYLDDFKTKDDILEPLKHGAIGDAYLELGEDDKALKFYNKALKEENEFTTPLFMSKAAFVYELQEEFEEAIELYEEIKLKYPDSRQEEEANKSITRLTIRKHNS
ncbi:MAG: tetratricopeptide repeat protein [Bacteroidales bacterium]